MWKSMNFYDWKDFLYFHQFCLSLNEQHISKINKNEDHKHSLYGFVETAHRTDIFGFEKDDSKYFLLKQKYFFQFWRNYRNFPKHYIILHEIMFCKLIFGFRRQLKRKQSVQKRRKIESYINFRDSGKFYSHYIMKPDKKVLQIHSGIM